VHFIDYVSPISAIRLNKDLGIQAMIRLTPHLSYTTTIVNQQKNFSTLYGGIIISVTISFSLMTRFASAFIAEPPREKITTYQYSTLLALHRLACFYWR